MRQDVGLQIDLDIAWINRTQQIPKSKLQFQRKTPTFHFTAHALISSYSLHPLPAVFRIHAFCVWGLCLMRLVARVGLAMRGQRIIIGFQRYFSRISVTDQLIIWPTTLFFFCQHLIYKCSLQMWYEADMTSIDPKTTAGKKPKTIVASTDSPGQIPIELETKSIVCWHFAIGLPDVVPRQDCFYYLLF